MTFAPKISVINIPFYLPPFPDPPIKSISNEKIIFGFLGPLRLEKGCDTFCNLAKTIKQRNVSNVGFMFLSPVKMPTRNLINKSLESGYVYLPVEKPFLSRKEIEMFGSEISYSVFPYRKNNYVGRSSGAIYDAFALGTPIIAFDIPCFSRYFQEYGDIGYLVQTVSEMEQIIANIIETTPWERHVEQQRNIRNARRDLSCLNHSQETNKKLLWM